MNHSDKYCRLFFDSSEIWSDKPRARNHSKFRKRHNYVRVGDMYELFYYDSHQQWRSAGRQVAVSDSLDFEVPRGTLYYLKNHTRGKDERIFEYDFDKREQIFR